MEEGPGDLLSSLFFEGVSSPALERFLLYEEAVDEVESFLSFLFSLAICRSFSACFGVGP